MYELIYNALILNIKIRVLQNFGHQVTYSKHLEKGQESLFWAYARRADFVSNVLKHRLESKIKYERIAFRWNSSWNVLNHSTNRNETGAWQGKIAISADGIISMYCGRRQKTAHKVYSWNKEKIVKNTLRNIRMQVSAAPSQCYIHRTYFRLMSRVGDLFPCGKFPILFIFYC